MRVARCTKVNIAWSGNGSKRLDGGMEKGRGTKWSARSRVLAGIIRDLLLPIVPRQADLPDISGAIVIELM